ncbi:MAG: hypothetical protein A3F83_14725 [Candidatus Glassbacteria bacterium RIFCSPLOWO2_12_FULL_58_11]|uniref:RiboL-PSP-HEPN domain-containing protein n=1 Tax=Candidatus Glassbacteria bacterium RIFCSPLOWO2_12_FULL_58_11 TaxID=1817867 RepID=A0A1F5YRP5_9BACT|nr:MAG: hypothetical protein A3F83_14725 [Candidatus Glassbacteria bacterium RIFCSPLOWO2_12_FULL_58_11]
MTVPRDYRGLIKTFREYPQEIQDFYFRFPALVAASDVGWEAPVSYLLVKFEYALMVTLYSGIVRHFGTDPEETWKELKNAMITRNSYKDQFENIFSTALSPALMKKIRQISDTRNELFHGKLPEPARLRKTMIEIFDFSKAFNEFVLKVGCFKPIGSLQGVIKSGKFSKKMAITKWVIKGLGFTKEGII